MNGPTVWRQYPPPDRGEAFERTSECAQQTAARVGSIHRLGRAPHDRLHEVCRSDAARRRRFRTERSQNLQSFIEPSLQILKSSNSQILRFSASPLGRPSYFQLSMAFQFE